MLRVIHTSSAPSFSGITGKNAPGFALLYIVAALLILSLLGAALVSLTATGGFHPLGRLASAQAFYLAESGYRYAASKYLQGESALDQINGQTFQVAGQGNFTVRIRTYDMDVNGSGGELSVRASFGYAPALPTNGSGGYLKIGSDPVQQFADVDIPDPEGKEVRFVKASGSWTASSGRKVRLAALSNGASVSEGGGLALQSGTADDHFPEHNGRFRADGRTYQYRTRDRDADVLRGVTRVGGPWIPPALSDGDPVVLQDLVVLRSTGASGRGELGARRVETYFVPITEAAGGSFHDPFADKSHWREDPDGSSTEGAHEVQDQGGDSALRVRETSQMSGTRLYSSLIELNPASSGLDMQSQWSSQGNFLSYDAQVKVKVDNEPVYMDGISFRLDGSGNSYGLSFLKSAADNRDGIPDRLVPESAQPMVVLWQRTGPQYEDLEWLAFKRLGPGSEILPETYFQDDMEDGSAKWTTADPAWSRTTTYSHSPQHSWHGSGDSAAGGSRHVLESRSFDLSNATAPQLSFWHAYRLTHGSKGRVEISTDGGGSWKQLGNFSGNSSPWPWWFFGPYWRNAQIDLTAYAGEPDVRLRFSLKVAKSPNADTDWFIDDVKVSEPESELNWPTLLVRAREAASVSFQNGGTEPIQTGDTVVGGSSGASGVVSRRPILRSGSWSGGDAAGELLLHEVSGTFSNGENLLVGGQALASASGFRAKDNYIQAFIGDPDAHGDPNSDPLDRNRTGNPRGRLNWPPFDVADTEPSNDHFTLIQWNDNLDGSVQRMGSGKEKDSIIRTGTLTTPDGGFPPDRPEVGLHTWGWGSRNGNPNENAVPDIYFDDFGLRLLSSGGGGFAPAIQE